MTTTDYANIVDDPYTAASSPPSQANAPKPRYKILDAGNHLQLHY